MPSLDYRKNVGLHHLALRAKSEEGLFAIFERVSEWLGVRIDFAPELLGAGPTKHAMIFEPGGNRIEFDFAS
ncbi:VOC family protein [Burkholderia multivorans]|uniref:VOC family protein n=1 Tax=Burkholderia multivorans TaxID=87883 RepID=UPI0012D9BA9E|nr:VOC family protein [Burkholderia multivorans]